ncbi:MAG: hypothetical protein CL608_08215 [Anaerolineaceae bacterium]|nr:hypothetical protein [Anaerolineaceae bacterium]
MKAKIKVLPDGRIQQYKILDGERPFTYQETVQKWQSDEPFRIFFINLLADAPFAAYFWETPPITKETLIRPFEFVLVNAPQLAKVPAQRHAFASYFSADPVPDPVVDFPNLGGDAHLIVPCPQAPADQFAHLAIFCRSASLVQQHQFWQRVGTAVQNQVGERPLWVSTSGLGVYWLHVRLDSRPKYYTFGPYREWS